MPCRQILQTRPESVNIKMRMQKEVPPESLHRFGRMRSRSFRLKALVFAKTCTDGFSLILPRLRRGGLFRGGSLPDCRLHQSLWVYAGTRSFVETHSFLDN